MSENHFSTMAAMSPFAKKGKVGFPQIPSYDEGTERVPEDQLALIHQDEAVLPVDDAEQYRQGKAEGMGRIGSTEEPKMPQIAPAPAAQSHGVLQRDENTPAQAAYEERQHAKVEAPAPLIAPEEKPTKGSVLADSWLNSIGAPPTDNKPQMPKYQGPGNEKDYANGQLIPERQEHNDERKLQVAKLEQQRQAALASGNQTAADKLEYAKSQLEKTPWADRSKLSKFGKIMSTVGNIAGDVVAPHVMALIPGTDLNRAGKANAAYNRIGIDTENDLKAAQTDAAQAKEAPKPKLLTGVENTRTDQNGNREQRYEMPDGSTQWVPEGQQPRAEVSTASAQQPSTGTPQYSYGKEKTDTAEDNKQRLEQNEANFRENPASVTGNDLKLLAQHQREVASAKIPEEIRAKIADAPVPADYAGGYHDPQYVKDLSAWTNKYDAAIDATPQAINAAAQKRIANNQRDESIRIANEKRGEETVQVFNPTTGGYDLMARADAPQGAKVFKDSPQFEKSVGKSQRLEDVTNKMLDYQQSFTTNLGEGDRENINKFIDSEYKSGNLPKIGSSEISLSAQVAGMEQMAKDNWQSNLSDEAKQRLNAYIVARTTALEMQRIETDSGRMSQGGMELDLGAIPRPTDTLDASTPKFKAFNRSVDTFAKAGVAPNMKTPAQIRAERSGAEKTVQMQAPDGTIQPVPASQVAHYKQLGAKEYKPKEVK